jgi:histidine triad (HIT) family protein
MTIAYDPENLFLKIVKGEIPSFKLFETEHVLAILDAFPTVPGHALLLPKAPGFATVMGRMAYLTCLIP